MLDIIVESLAIIGFGLLMYVGYLPITGKLEKEQSKEKCV